jgi:hypothetical protein
VMPIELAGLAPRVGYDLDLIRADLGRLLWGGGVGSLMSPLHIGMPQIFGWWGDWH